MLQSGIHAAIIMDGNGRWASRRSLPRFAGHQAGAEALRQIVECAPDCGISVLTVYAFSADNWKRPPEEVSALMELLAAYLDNETDRCLADGVRISVIGRRDRLSPSLVASIRSAERATENCTRIRLRLAIDYSARDAILRATNRASGEKVTQERFEELLGQFQPVDILIRTGGEQRLSDFLLWESAYAELFFTDTMWPDFGAADLRRAVREYQRRDRRFGGLPQAMAGPCPDENNERWLR